MSVATEEARIRGQLETIEVVESVSATFPEDDERRAQLLDAVNSMLAQMEPVRVEIAARLLDISDKTVRAWAKEGVLTPATQTPRLLLQPARLHEVLHLVKDLKAAGRDRKMLDLIWFRLSDQALLDRDDLQESLRQMAAGEGRLLNAKQFGQSTKDS